MGEDLYYEIKLISQDTSTTGAKIVLESFQQTQSICLVRYGHQISVYTVRLLQFLFDKLQKLSKIVDKFTVDLFC